MQLEFRIGYRVKGLQCSLAIIRIVGWWGAGQVGWDPWIHGSAAGAAARPAAGAAAGAAASAAPACICYVIVYASRIPPRPTAGQKIEGFDLFSDGSNGLNCRLDAFTLSMFQSQEFRRFERSV